MEIRYRCACSTCKGSGIIHSDWWQAWYKRKEQHQAEQGLTSRQMDEVEDKWLTEQGYSGWNDKRLPPEDSKCLRCEGAGIEEGWVNIDDTSLANHIYNQHPELSPA